MTEINGPHFREMTPEQPSDEDVVLFVANQEPARGVARRYLTPVYQAAFDRLVREGLLTSGSGRPARLTAAGRAALKARRPDAF